MQKSFIEVNLEQGSPEWLEYRNSKITSTDAAKILELDPYESARSLWKNKQNPKQQFCNAAMQHGKETEPHARLWAEIYFGQSLPPKVIESVIWPDAAASLDGMCDEFLIEIKCPTTHDKFIDLCIDIPDHYYAQIQHSLFVSGYSKCWFIPFFEQEGVPIVVYRNQKFILDMIEKEKKFKQSLIDFEMPKKRRSKRIGAID